MAEKQIKVELRDPKELKPYEFNNKTHPRSQLDELIKSIQEDWFRWVVTVDENDVIISGHGRVMACIELWIKVPTIKYDDMDQVQKIRNRIKDNRINDLADWEYKNISHELDELHWLGYDDLDELMAPFIDDLEPDEDYIDNNVRVDKIQEWRSSWHSYIQSHSTGIPRWQVRWDGWETRGDYGDYVSIYYIGSYLSHGIILQCNRTIK